MSDHTNGSENGNLAPPPWRAVASAADGEKSGKTSLAVKKSTKNKRARPAGHEAV